MKDLFNKKINEFTREQLIDLEEACISCIDCDSKPSIFEIESYYWLECYCLNKTGMSEDLFEACLNWNEIMSDLKD